MAGARHCRGYRGSVLLERDVKLTFVGKFWLAYFIWLALAVWAFGTL
jgi:hypothetical protein